MRPLRNLRSRAETAARGALVLALLAAVGAGCGEGGNYSRGKDAGGSGGSSSGTGGDVPSGTGGSTTGSGGAGAGPVASGGAGVGTGGAQTGGAGGRVGTGGAAGSGGGATAGTSGGNGGAGGRGTGGAASGGSGTGGRGGANTGGAATGGANAGGANTGGAATGGANTGGAATGGANTGGAATGGMGTGGAATGGMGTGGAAAPTGALLYYPFNETTGTAVADQSGNARNGVVTGAGTFAAGMVGNGLTLAGGASSGTPTYVTVPAGLLNAVTDLTISVWVKVTTRQAWQRVLDFGKSSTTGYMFLTTNGPSDVVRFCITATDRFAEQTIDGPALALATWKHLAVVLGSTGATLYVDGVSVRTSATFTLRPTNLGTITNHWLGRSQFADPYFNGQLDELRIYGRALSAAEVAQLFTLR